MMISFLMNQNSDFNAAMESSLWKTIDINQKKAYEKVLNLVLLLQKQNFQKYLDQTDDFGLEGQAAGKVLEAKKQLRIVLALQIKGIFGRVDRNEIAAAELELKTKTKIILNRYGRADEVIDFARQVKTLLGNTWDK
jgi:hypothetical protein